MNRKIGILITMLAMVLLPVAIADSIIPCVDTSGSPQIVQGRGKTNELNAQPGEGISQHSEADAMVTAFSQELGFLKFDKENFRGNYWYYVATECQKYTTEYQEPDGTVRDVTCNAPPRKTSDRIFYYGVDGSGARIQDPLLVGSLEISQYLKVNAQHSADIYVSRLLTGSTGWYSRATAKSPFIVLEEKDVECVGWTNL